MVAINFTQIGSFNGLGGEAQVLNNPTSLQFGDDGRLYVAEQNGTINAFTVELQAGTYVAIAHEVLTLPNGAEVVKSIQNHNDDGTLNNNPNRQVTGLLVTGTALNPELYISSSDPRISKNEDVNLDTNSGVLTRVSWTGTQWEAVDIIRGLPRSEENHSVNGMVLSQDGSKLYLTVGGNTNNGAPSAFFANTPEYTLAGTVLEIDLQDINSRPILTDSTGGQQNTARQYIYDLPTLDDPSVPNDNIRETQLGLDVAGPFGGNDGFNQAILPADAPIRIYADGFRNHYDLVLTESGNLYTVDNGANVDAGGNPLDANGVPTDQTGAGPATNIPNNLGTGDPEPLFLIEDGGYYGHPNPIRSNQTLELTVLDDAGQPDASIFPNSSPNAADLVPDSVLIENGFVIDPSRFTDDIERLTQSGIRIERSSPQSNALVTLGSSSNGLVEYTNPVFDGALQGALLVSQFNGNVTLLNLNDNGTELEPFIDPGNDGILGTTDDEVLAQNGVFPLITGQSQPLDVTTGPDGSIWVAEFGNDLINVFSPSASGSSENNDFDGDGIFNSKDPFIRDASNGGNVLLTPGQSLLWDFDANQDNNLPGPNGYGGGLTGVAVNGVTDYEQFFQELSNQPGQIINLDNVKFTTAAAGGTTVIEAASNGDIISGLNNAEYLFHTGVAISPTVESFTIKWSVFNPAQSFTGALQQIGGYIGTGDQSNYLKIVAIQGLTSEIQLLLENNDVIQASSFLQADDLFSASSDQQIFFELEIDPTAATATPTVTYETTSDITKTVTGSPLDLSETTILDAIRGNYTVDGQPSNLAVGLLSSNFAQPAENTFQAVFNDIEITAPALATAPEQPQSVLYRVNAGGPEIAAVDGGIAWSEDTANFNSPFLANPGSNGVAFSGVKPAAQVPATIPEALFNTERWDQVGGSEMQWAFDIPNPGLYEVRLYMGNGFNGTNDPGERVFDVAIEGTVPESLNDIDLSQQFGHLSGGIISHTVNISDDLLNIDFLHNIQNPLVNGIEILQVGDPPTGTAPEIISVSSVQVLENQTSVLDVEATDADGDDEGSGLAFSLAGGVDEDAFTINPNTGMLSFIDPPNFEAPSDANGDNIFNVTVKVTDSSNLSDTQNINIAVEDLNETVGGLPIRLEGENADIFMNYRTENISIASNGVALSLRANVANEQGSATFNFSGNAGLYDVVVGTFDENDGLARFEIELNDLETSTTIFLGEIELNSNLGSNIATPQTAISPIVASNVALTPGDSITVTGFENGFEFARLDYLELRPVG